MASSISDTVTFFKSVDLD